MDVCKVRKEGSQNVRGDPLIGNTQGASDKAGMSVFRPECLFFLLLKVLLRTGKDFNHDQEAVPSDSLSLSRLYLPVRVRPRC